MGTVTRLSRLYSSMAIGISILLCLAMIGCTSVPSSEPTISTTTTTTTTSTAVATPTPSPTLEPTVSPKPTVTPIPTIIPTPTIPPELVGVPPERLQFVKDLLNLYDHSVSSDNTAFDKVDDYITREQIVEYGRTGDFSKVKDFSIISHKDGTPAIALINCKDNVVSSFKTAIKEMEVYDPNYLKVLTSNGMRAFMVNRFAENMGNVFTFNKSGLIVWNLDINKDFSVNNLKRPLETESFGIKMYQLGGDYAKYVGFMKEQLSSDCWWYIFKRTGDAVAESGSRSSYIITKTLYNPYYAPITFKDEKIQDLLKSVRDNNLATPFGGTWAEISASIVDRPDWELSDAQ